MLSLPTRGFPALFYLLSSDSDTLCQAVTHGSGAWARGMPLTAPCGYRAAGAGRVCVSFLEAAAS